MALKLPEASSLSIGGIPFNDDLLIVVEQEYDQQTAIGLFCCEKWRQSS
jgi:hypothetical protein